MSLTATVRRMEQAGFGLRAVDEQLLVSNGNQLNEAQRTWIQQHKSDLMHYLKVIDDPAINEMMTLFDAEIVVLHPLVESPT